MTNWLAKQCRQFKTHCLIDDIHSHHTFRVALSYAAGDEILSSGKTSVSRHKFASRFDFL